MWLKLISVGPFQRFVHFVRPSNTCRSVHVLVQVDTCWELTHSDGTQTFPTLLQPAEKKTTDPCKDGGAGSMRNDHVT